MDREAVGSAERGQVDRREARRAAENDIDHAGIGAAAIVPVGADRDVAQAIPVEIAGGGNPNTRPGAGDAARNLDPVGRVELGKVDRPDARRAAEDEIDRALLAVAAIGADGDIVEAVAIDVPGRRDAVAGIVIGCRAVDPDPFAGTEIAQVHLLTGRLPPEDQIDGAGIGPPGVVVRRRDEDIVETIAVDVAGRGDGKAGAVVGGIAEDLEAVGRVEFGEVDRADAAGLAEDHISGAGIVAAFAIRRRAEEEVGKAVAVDVAGPGKAPAEPIVNPFAEKGGIGGRTDRRGWGRRRIGGVRRCRSCARADGAAEQDARWARDLHGGPPGR